MKQEFFIGFVMKKAIKHDNRKTHFSL